MTSLSIGRVCATVAAVAFLIGAAPALAESVGKAGAAKPLSTGTAPGAGSRELAAGSSIFFKDHIATSASGAVQVVFVDRSTLAVGPQADVTIDEFVYDPNGGTGKFVTSVTKGSFRLITGGLNGGGEIVIKTPSATIGVRG